MRRVSPASRVTVATISPSKRGKYVARTDYGTRSAELQKQSLPFGKYRATLYRRSDVDRSSWFLRVFLREEGRHYRKSLRTSDRAEAVQRATTELVSVLSKVESGQRILAISLKDLVRRFSAHLEQQVASGALSPRTLTSQRYRVNLGCEFLKVKLAAGMDAKVSGIDGEVFGQYLDWRMAKAAEDRPNGKIRRDVVRDELLVIRKMFLFARKEKLCSEKAIPNWDFVVERRGLGERALRSKTISILSARSGLGRLRPRTKKRPITANCYSTSFWWLPTPVCAAGSCSGCGTKTSSAEFLPRSASFTYGRKRLRSEGVVKLLCSLQRAGGPMARGRLTIYCDGLPIISVTRSLKTTFLLPSTSARNRPGTSFITRIRC
jgi:hypothetical protein